MKSRSAEVDVNRLCEAVGKARLTLKRYRAEMREMVRQSVGAHWSDEGTQESVPLNLIAIYQSIVGRKLVPQSPRVKLSTWNKSDKAAVNAMESWANTEIENMNFAQTLRRVVTGALYSIGITKVALATPADAGHRNWALSAGTPFADEVLLDDFVFDVHARCFEEVGFLGHRSRVPFDLIKDSRLYDAKGLQATEDKFYNTEGDERIGVLGRSFYSNREEYEDFVDIWEIYMPRHRQVITITDDYMSGPSVGQGGKPLRVVDWIGPDEGPYEILGYGLVPGNAMPAGPLQNLKDLHMAANNILRKQIRQAQRQKEQLLVGGGATEDAQRITAASDGDAVKVDNAEACQPRLFGGPNPQNFALLTALQQMFSWSAGNLDIIGGLSPQSKTATQDKMLNDNSSALMMAMQETTVSHARRVIKRLCWYWWNHPQKVMETTWSPQGMPEYSIQRKVHPKGYQGPGLKRTGRLADMDVQVDPYSMQSQTPASQLAAMDQMIMQIVLPALPLLEKQGIVLNMGKYLSLRGKLMNMQEITEILSITEPPQTEGSSGGPQEPGMPQSTERTYTRRSEANNTADNQAANTQRMMEGVQSGGQENGTVNR